MPSGSAGGGAGAGSDAASASASALPSPPDRIPGRCDICNRPDGGAGAAAAAEDADGGGDGDGRARRRAAARRGKRGKKARPTNDNMQKCRRCGLLVHELCNGMVPTTRKDPDWVCSACASVGASAGGAAVRQTERPTECVLCGVGGGGSGATTDQQPPHAMHPLYDRFGEEGRQVVLPASSSTGRPRRLAWVHTLCAFFVGTNPITRGCVIGCDEDGVFRTDEDDEESSDFLDSDGEREADFGDVGGGGTANKGGGTKTSQKVDGTADHDDEDDDDGDDDDDDNDHSQSQANEAQMTYTHHFVMADEEPWRTRIRDCRQTTCFLCKRKDDDKTRVPLSLRIPVQCAAGDVEQLRRHRRFFPPDEPGCAVAMHVGCARWMRDRRSGAHVVHDGVRRWRVLYSPGGVATTVVEDSDSTGGGDAFAECYCNDHAKVIAMFKGGDRSSPSSHSSSDGSKSKSQSKSGSGSTRNAPQPQAPPRRQPSSSSSATTAAAKAGTGKRAAPPQRDHQRSASASGAGAPSGSNKRARKNWDKLRSNVVGPRGAGGDGAGAAGAAASSREGASSSSSSSSRGGVGGGSIRQSKKAPAPAAAPAPRAGAGITVPEERARRASLEDVIASRTLLPPGRGRDHVDGRYEWGLRRGGAAAGGGRRGSTSSGGGDGDNRPLRDETPWTGTSALERALVGCCAFADDDGVSSSPPTTGGGAIRPGREGQFLALAAVHCRTVSDRSLALAIMHRSNLAGDEGQRQVMANFLSLGGMKLLMEWFDEASTPKHPDGSEPHHASPTGPLLLPILQVLEKIPVDVELVKELKMNKKLRALAKRLKQVVKKNNDVRCHPAAGGLDVSAVRSALERLMDSWREKANEPAPTRGRGEREVFADLFARMKSQYDLLAEYEAKDETAPWIERIIASRQRAPANEKMRLARQEQAKQKKRIEREREARRREAEAKKAQVSQDMGAIRAEVLEKEATLQAELRKNQLQVLEKDAKLQAEIRKNQLQLMEARQKIEDRRKSMEQMQQKRKSSMMEELGWDGKTRRAKVRWADEEEGKPLEEVKSIKARSPVNEVRGSEEAKSEADHGPDIDGIRGRVARHETADSSSSETKGIEADLSNESGDSPDANHDGGTAVTDTDGLASRSEGSNTNTQVKKTGGAVVGEARMFDI